MALSIVVLAAGQGRRMQSSIPKPLHALAGKPMLLHVLDTIKPLAADQILVVYSHGLAEFEQACQHHPVTFVEQAEQCGTGHAVHQALSHIPADNQVLVLYADVPLLTEQLCRDLLDKQSMQSMAVMTTVLDKPQGFGRIVRDQNQHIVSIVEERDATALEKEISEINTGVMCIPQPLLATWLPQLTNSNAQGEYYLTDCVAMAVQDGVRVHGVIAAEAQSVLGVNDRVQLASMERQFQRRQAQQWLKEGVTLLDPERVDCRGQCQFGRDVVIDVGVVFEGQVVIGDGCHIGPYTVLRDVTLAAGVTIKAFSVLEGATIGEQAIIGPYARIRPQSHIGPQARVGNFVEVKNSRIGASSKASHLSYLGDATIEEQVNIGAGVITCNYDGFNKHSTHIGSQAFIGSNSALVAPMTVGSGAWVAAGSTVTEDAPAQQLTIARTRQQVVSSWSPKVKEKTE